MTVILVVDGNTCRITGPLSSKVSAALDDTMKFQPLNYGDGRHRTENWDGYIHLYDRKIGTFPRGFLVDVQDLLEVQEIPFEFDIIESHFATMHGWGFDGQLHDYQDEAVERWLEEGGRGVISLPCGTGKTVTACRIIADMGVPTLVLVHRIDLLKQWCRSLRRFVSGICEVGEVWGESRRWTPLTVASVMTVNALRRESLLNAYGLVIFDESHHLGADVIYDIAVSVRAEYLLGLSATPFREDRKDLMLKAALGEVVLQYSFSEMISARFLARPTIYIYRPLHHNYGNGGHYKNVYEDAIIHNEDRNNLIASVAQEWIDRGKSVYVHVKRIAHGHRLAALIPGSKFLHGLDKVGVREQTMNDFMSRAIPCLVSTLLGEGIDLPQMDVLVLACAGRSKVFVQQVVGRVLRLTRSKRHCVVIDFYDDCKFLREQSEARIEWYRGEKEFRIRDGV